MQDAIETTTDHALAELRRIRGAKQHEATRLERFAAESAADAERYTQLAQQAREQLASIDALIGQVA